jgi:hypothetical protein
MSAEYWFRAAHRAAHFASRIDGHQHIVPAEQHPAAGRALKRDLLRPQPSIDRTDVDAAQERHFFSRQKYLVVGIWRRHNVSLRAA